jgi:mannose-6-phosphate isomerase-like protein (cupin superfamily)
MKAIPVILFSVVAAFGPWAMAQDEAKTVDRYSPAELMQMEKALGQKTDATGTATQTLKKYATDYTLLAYRNKSGKAELHEKFADFYVVLDGEATLVSGGHMVNGATTAPGEVRADSIQGGTETKLKKGDIIHIPANIPHQVVLANGTTFQYFVVKVQEVN